MEKLASILAHTLEITVLLFVAYVVTHWLNLGGEQTQDTIAVALAATAKVIRVMVYDYVNS